MVHSAVHRLFMIHPRLFSLAAQSAPLGFTPEAKLPLLLPVVNRAVKPDMPATGTLVAIAAAGWGIPEASSHHAAHVEVDNTNNGAYSAIIHEGANLSLDESEQAFTLEWRAGPLNDLIADAVAATLLQSRRQ